MTTTTTTPGGLPTPWRPYPTGPRGPWCVADADGGTVCAVHASEGEPIARLLAAAPDLLTALRALHAWVASGAAAPFSRLAQLHGGGPTMEECARIEEIGARVKAAIGKATGEASS